MARGPAIYTVVLQERGGRELTKLPWSQITWERILDDCSSAQVTVPVSSPAHPLARFLDRLEGFALELAIWRYVSRARQAEIWVGPVTEPEWGEDGVSIPARDLSLWLDHRVLPFDRSFDEEDLASIFAALADDAMSQDRSPGLVITPKPTGILGSRSVLAAARRYGGDELRELARDGVDYTVIGRNMLVGGVEVPTNRMPNVDNATLRKAKLKGLGLNTATKVHVIGSSGTNINVPISAEAGGATPRVGLVERVFNESAIEDNGSADAAAVTRHDACRVMPLALTGDLDPLRGPQIDKLIPGALCHAELYAGCKYVDQDVRLSRVNGSITAGEQGVDETVSLEFIPVGSRQEQS